MSAAARPSFAADSAVSLDARALDGAAETIWPDTSITDSSLPPTDADTGSDVTGEDVDVEEGDASTSDVFDVCEDAGVGVTVSSQLGLELLVVDHDRAWAAGTAAHGVYSIALATGATSLMSPLGRSAALALDDTHVFWADGAVPTDGKLAKQLRGGGPTEFRLLPGEPVTGLAAAAGDQLCRTVIVSGKGGLVRCGPRDFTDVVDTTERPGTAPIVGMPKAACYFDWATFIPGSGCTGFWGGGLFGYTVGKGGVQHRTLAAYDDFLWIVGDIVIGSANPLTGDDGPRIIPPPAPDVSAIAVDGKGVALGTSSGRIYLVDRSSGKQALLACDEGPVTAIALNATDVLWIRPTDGALRAAKR